MAVAAVATLVGFVIAGCGGSGGTTSSGAFETVLTDERLVPVAGSRCAVEGHATNVGNLRARVQLTLRGTERGGRDDRDSVRLLRGRAVLELRFPDGRLRQRADV